MCSDLHTVVRKLSSYLLLLKKVGEPSGACVQRQAGCCTARRQARQPAARAPAVVCPQGCEGAGAAALHWGCCTVLQCYVLQLLLWRVEQGAALAWPACLCSCCCCFCCHMPELACCCCALASACAWQAVHACMLVLSLPASAVAGCLPLPASRPTGCLQRDEAVKSADDSEALAGLAAGLAAGLKALHVFSNTGQGRRMPAAREPVQAAWQARGELLSAAQRQQFEGFVGSSRNFAALLEERSPSPEPVRRDYVPAPRQQPQRRERRQKRQAVVEEAPSGEGDEGQPLALSRRQLRRLQAAQRAEAEAAEAAAARQQQLEEAARQAAAAEARRKAAEEEAANRTYKLTIKLGTASLPIESAAVAPDQPHQGERPPEDTALAAALDDHWRWHHQQQAAPAQLQPDAQEAPPLPPDDEPGGWQAVPSPLDAPLSPVSAPASPAALAAAAVAANGSAGALPDLGLNPGALEHAASGSPVVRQLLG